MSAYIVTQVEPPACMGEFSSRQEAIAWAENYKQFGLCSTYTIGTYINGVFVGVYDSRKRENV